MRIGVIADTHIPDRAGEIPKIILEEFKKVDMVVHAGDLVDLGVLDKLRGACSQVKAVRGNMDHEAVRNKLPEKEIFKIGNYRFGVMHGYGAPNSLVDLLASIFQNDKVDIVIYGHSHRGASEKRGNTLFFNPGSPTDKIFSPYNSYGIIEINDKIEARIIKL